MCSVAFCPVTEGTLLMTMSRSQTGWEPYVTVPRYSVFFVSTAPSGPGTPQCQGFTTTLRSTTLGWTLDERPLPDNIQFSQHTDFHAACGIRTRSFSKRAAADQRLKVPIHVRWVKLVRVWSATSRTLAYYIYIYTRAWLPSQAPRRGLASQTRTCMGTFRLCGHWDRPLIYCSTMTLIWHSLFHFLLSFVWCRMDNENYPHLVAEIV
jgi:hypothetical protein